MSSTHSLVPVPAPSIPAITLGEELSDLEQAALSARTKAIYECQLKYVYAWLDAHGQDMSDDALASYLHERFYGRVRSITKPETFLKPASPATCALVVSAVVSEAKLRGRPSPIGPRTRRTLGGIRRTGRSRGRGQKAGLSWKEIDLIVAVALQGEPDVIALRDVAVIMLMSDCLLRIAELTAIETQHITTQEDGTGRLFLPVSKTDQEGAGSLLFVRRTTMRAIATYQEEAGVDGGTLFRRMRRGSTVLEAGLSTVSARAIIVRRARAAGIEADISGHSPRIGAAGSIADEGGSLPDIMGAGRWKSPVMAAHYCRRSDAGRGAIARLRDDPA